MALKTNAGLRDDEQIEFAIEIVSKDGEKWVREIWGVYTKTLSPFYKHQAPGRSGMIFLRHEIAEEAARALKKAYPDQRFRVTQRNTIIEETYVMEAM